MKIEKTSMGKTPDGQEVDAYTLSNAHGLKATIMTYGATLISMETPDRSGKLTNITLSLDCLKDYLAGHPFFGSIAGRYANRITKGRFTLDGVEYRLATNMGTCHLHGGVRGFDKYVWTAKPAQGGDAAEVAFSMESPDGDEGYPGKLSVTVVYTLTADDRLIMDYTASTDKATVLNLTNHAYWNLGSPASGNILDHKVWIDADRYLPMNDDMIPTGELRSVKGGPWDFTSPHTIGERIAQVPGGYDHCYIFNKSQDRLRLGARVVHGGSGRAMEVYTTQPAVQLYVANFLDGTLQGGGVRYGKNWGLCLETQHYPDSPNKPAFPSTVLRPGQTYRETTVHKFSVQ